MPGSAVVRFSETTVGKSSFICQDSAAKIGFDCI
jgi:hypothetical protein